LVSHFVVGKLLLGCLKECYWTRSSASIYNSQAQMLQVNRQQNGSKCHIQACYDCEEKRFQLLIKSEHSVRIEGEQEKSSERQPFIDLILPKGSPKSSRCFHPLCRIPCEVVNISIMAQKEW
jgi:hypothetical protein